MGRQSPRSLESGINRQMETNPQAFQSMFNKSGLGAMFSRVATQAGITPREGSPLANYRSGVNLSANKARGTMSSAPRNVFKAYGK